MIAARFLSVLLLPPASGWFSPFAAGFFMCCCGALFTAAVNLSSFDRGGLK